VIPLGTGSSDPPGWLDTGNSATTLDGIEPEVKGVASLSIVVCVADILAGVSMLRLTIVWERLLLLGAWLSAHT
jgi:hypothetical protein